MRVNTQFPVAVHVLLLIAAYSDEFKVTSDFISKSSGINPVLIRNIFTKLKKAELLLTSAGRGRTRLARVPGKITLWDVYAAMEPGTAKGIFALHRNISQKCPVGRFISTKLTGHLEDTVTAMRSEMSKTNLATLLKDLAASDSGQN